MDILNPDEFYRIWSQRIMIDEYATLRTAFHAGATIQAYTVEGDDGRHPLWNVAPHGYWRDLSCDGEPKFSCHPTRYRVNPEGA